ncbi:uncharacterized protein LOC131843444 [Achroia grisella]|uniref:uncharacterized protein LOC131843444 n=1 Tax=Achroia grisella TaxID=688607 RepID=UPI0027D276E6|nr:uncharacterized protein LOC131843444 [Achroia grisella]
MPVTRSRTGKMQEEKTEEHQTDAEQLSDREKERQKQIAIAREEVIRYRLQLAEVKLARLEAFGEEDEEPSEPASQDGHNRVVEWLEQQSEPPPPPPEAPPNPPKRPTPARIEEPLRGTIETHQRLAPTDTIQVGDLATAVTEIVRATTASLAAVAPHPQASTSGPLAAQYRGELTPFYGAHTDWLAFKAAYEESAGYLTPSQNIERLRRALRGEARSAMKSLLIANTPAEEIMHELELTFGRPNNIAEVEITKLRSLPPPKDTPGEFCRFATAVKNSIVSLKTLKKINFLYNPEVAKLLIEKLPPNIRHRWYVYCQQQAHEDVPDLVQYYNFVKIEAEIYSVSAEPMKIASMDDKPKPSESRRVQIRPQRTHTASKTDSPPRHKPTCPVCKSNSHTAAQQCEKFKKENSYGRWEIAKAQRLCFRCLQYRTQTHNCKTKTCGIDDCPRMHHKLLHYRAASETQKTETATVSTGVSLTRSPRSYLKILPVKIVGPRASIDTFALLDDGSTVTLIDEEIATRVGAEGPTEPLKIEALAGATVRTNSSRRVTLTLCGSEEEYEISARTMKGLKLAKQQIEERDIRRCQHLAGIKKILCYHDATPTILIGQDNWELLLAIEVRRGSSSQPVASKTPLGWVLHGASTRSLGHQVHHVYHIREGAEDRIEEELRRYFSIESLGVLPRKTRADPQERALQILQKKTRALPDGGYSTSLLWKTDKVELPNNYDAALNRLYSTEKKIDRNPQLKEEYERQIALLIEKGYAEEAATTPSDARTWYLPHFPVLHPAKPGKVRPVFDAAARARGTSLNDHLLTGPDLLQSLPGVLMRFRQHPIAVAADIEEMFLRIEINEEDRDVLRFLWRQHRREGPPREYRMKAVIFGAACSPCIALYIKNHNAEQHKEQYPRAADAIIHNHYMDDYLQSFQTEEEAMKITHEVDTVHRKAKFHLRKWTSNSPQLQEKYNSTRIEDRTVSIDRADKEEKILGLTWRPATDTLGFNLNMARIPQEIVNGSRTPTKREALRTVMSLFDPLGLASPVTVQAKGILQETWRIGIGWDEKLPEKLAEDWTKWTQHLINLRHINVPRCHPELSSASSRELHTFVDASENAYAASVYWRVQDKDGNIHVTLAIAKARVSPLKIVSIPRLELQAAVLGCRLARTATEEYQIKPDRRYFWSDSRTVLAWLRAGPRTFKPFVAHRVAEIEEETKANEWKWVPTRHNVADDATRGVPTDFDTEHRWFTGPQFLYKPQEEWPGQDEPGGITTDTGEERTHMVYTGDSNTTDSGVLPDITRFTSWLRLLRATARVLQFIDRLREAVENRKNTASQNAVHYRRTARNIEKDPAWNKKTARKIVRTAPRFDNSEERNFIKLTAEYIQRAEQLWIRAAQQESFKNEIETLRGKGTVDNNSRLKPLAVIEEDGYIKLKSRIAAVVDVTDSMKKPIVLDGNHRYTQLYLDWVHRTHHHAGVELVMNEARQHYWILRARPTIRSIVKRCQLCRLRRATTSIPPTGDHPVSRLAHHQRPFTYTGVDFFGPLSVTVGRQHHKRYVALFTCLTTRAVHLELTTSLSTDSAISALRRMMARRGKPTEIWSDNGTNFHGADAELRRAAIEASREDAANHRIRWRFISPSAPFMGGAWERLVRSVKTALAATLHERHPSEETLVTLLCEAEYTVNSRPLTHVSTEPDDEEALTPNHFLLGGSGKVQTPGSFEDTDIDSRSHWKRAQRLADHFWSRWLREYLPELQHRREPRGTGQPLRIGDLVLIVDSNLPRNTWPRGRVIAVFPGPDGVIRVADIQTKNGVLRRPTKRLVVLPTGVADSEERAPEPDKAPAAPSTTAAAAGE